MGTLGLGSSPCWPEPLPSQAWAVSGDGVLRLAHSLEENLTWSPGGGGLSGGKGSQPSHPRTAVDVRADGMGFSSAFPTKTTWNLCPCTYRSRFLLKLILHGKPTQTAGRTEATFSWPHFQPAVRDGAGTWQRDWSSSRPTRYRSLPCFTNEETEVRKAE